MAGGLLAEASPRENAESMSETNFTAAFERLAEDFYRETGFIAPGKSVPLEMAATQHDDERRAAWRKWLNAREQRRSPRT